MTQAEAVPTVVRVHIRRGKLLATGIVAGLFAAAMTAYGWYILSITGSLHFLAVLCAIMALLCAFYTVYAVGLSLKNPIALRMDRDGVSGFYTAPAKWREIEKISVFTGSKGHKFLGFTLKDSFGFRARQTAFQRFRSWDAFNGTGAHIVVPASVLRNIEVEDLLTQAKTFHLSTHADVT